MEDDLTAFDRKPTKRGPELLKGGKAVQLTSDQIMQESKSTLLENLGVMEKQSLQGRDILTTLSLWFLNA